MNEQIADADAVVAAAVIESPVVDVPMTVATVNEMLAWRSSPVRKTGDAFCYFQGPSLMRIRSRDMAADAVGKLALDLWRAGRVQLTQAKIGDGEYRYLATACESDPMREPVVKQPARVRTKVLQV
jgi:hypothetical protein